MIITIVLLLLTGTTNITAPNPIPNKSKQNSLIDTASFLVKQFNENVSEKLQKKDYGTKNIVPTILQLEVCIHMCT
jgi:hypothetical protein